MTRKILAIVLALAMVFALCLTACGGEQAEEKETTKAAEKETTKAEEKETTAADTDEETFELETVDWYCRRDMSNTPDFDEYVWPAMQEYFLETLNIQAEYHGFGGSDYMTKFQTAITSNTGIDLYFLAANATNFYVWYTRGAMEPLDDLLNTYAPDLLAEMPEFGWQSGTIDGKIYAMPTIKDLVIDINFTYNQTMMQELGMEDAFFDIDFTNAKDLNDYFYAVKEARDEAHPDWADVPLNALYTTEWAFWKADEVSKGVYAKIDNIGCFEDESDEGVFSMAATSDYKDNLYMIQTWVKDNINPYDSKNFTWDDLKKEGKYFGGFGWGSVLANTNQWADYGWLQELRHPTYAFTNTLYPLYCFQSINALTTDSKKVAAMRLYDCLCMDSYVATSMRFGKEGVHWEKSTDSTGATRANFDFEGGRNSDGSAYGYYMWYFAEFGNLYSVYIPSTQGEGFLEALSAMNNSALVSNYLGFMLDTANVENEIAACANVRDEYHTDLMYGMIEDIDGHIDAFNAQLEANGIQAIMDECNAQMETWKAAQ